MQFGYARIELAKVDPTMVGVDFPLTNATGFQSIQMVEWSGWPTVVITPNPHGAILIVSCKTSAGWKTHLQPIDEPINLSLDVDNSLNAILIGIMP